MKTISECTEREKRRRRKLWRRDSKNYRARLKNLRISTCETPPESDIEEPSLESVQKTRGRKAKKRDRAKAYRKIAKQEKLIKELTKRVGRYKRKYFRFKESVQKNPQTSPSPNKKVSLLVGPTKVSPAVRKQLLRGFVLEKQLTSQVRMNAASVKRNRLVKKSIGNHILRKYRVVSYFKSLVSRKINYESEEPRQPKQGKVFKMKDLIANFFEDDKISQLCPGKRDFVRKNKSKLQRRLLLDSIQNSHKKFVEETGLQISYASFLRYKPYWITKPKARDRETCGCIKHANFELLLSTLSKGGAIAEKTSQQCLAAVACDVKNRECMIGECNNCKNKKIRCLLDGSVPLRMKRIFLRENRFRLISEVGNTY